MDPSPSFCLTMGTLALVEHLGCCSFRIPASSTVYWIVRGEAGPSLLHRADRMHISARLCLPFLSWNTPSSFAMRFYASLTAAFYRLRF